MEGVFMSKVSHTDEDVKGMSDDLNTDAFYNPVNQMILRKSIAQLDAGNGTRHELIEDTENS